MASDPSGWFRHGAQDEAMPDDSPNRASAPGIPLPEKVGSVDLLAAVGLDRMAGSASGVTTPRG